MPGKYSKDPQAYIDIVRYMDKALEAEAEGARGIKVTCGSSKLASQIRRRMHDYRCLDRDLSREIYPLGHEMHGRSIYDRLIISKAKGDGTLFLTFVPKELEIEVVLGEEVDKKISKI